MQDAQKEFKRTGEESKRMAAQVASDKYENARRNLKLVSDEARSTAKEIKSMSDAISKADNRAGSLKKVIGSKGSEDTGKSILSSLARSGHCPNDRKLLVRGSDKRYFIPRFGDQSRNYVRNHTIKHRAGSGYGKRCRSERCSSWCSRRRSFRHYF